MDFQSFFNLVEEVEMKRPLGKNVIDNNDLEKWKVNFHVMDSEVKHENDRGIYVFELEDGFAIAKRKKYYSRYYHLTLIGFQRYQNLIKVDKNHEVIQKLYQKKKQEIETLEKIISK